MKGLIIQQPHLDNILSGLKTWEIRSRNTKFRGFIALCDGTYIYGFAKIVNSFPIDREELKTREAVLRHRASKFLKNYKPNQKILWVWELSDVKKLKNPIPHGKRAYGSWITIEEDRIKFLPRNLMLQLGAYGEEEEEE